VPIGRPPRDAWPRFARTFEQAALERGVRACEDSNAPDATGVGPFPRNVEGPLRASSAAVFLEPVRDRPNLELHADTTVDRVVLDRGRAVGVEARNAAGEPRRIEADRVVLCGGFAKSPQILMLSGIGPAAELRRHGVAVEVDLPVGETLCDHPTFILFGFATDASGSQFGPRVQLRCGSTPDGVNDLLLIPALVEPRSLGIVPPPGVSSLAMISAAVARPRSRGTLRLASPDPSRQPEIRLNLLGEPADVEKAREAVRLACELATTAPLAGEIAGLLTELPDLEDEPELDTWLRANVTTSMHGACTCRMGPADDERAVVGQDLAVHGVEDLYVADASVMPELTTGAVNLTCMLIGERLARDLLAAG
jgi:choline dehydrogenase